MTLYRKYRSQKLSELVGQPQVTEMLGQAIRTKKIAHAYLFAGPRGTGKTSVARIVSKAINCLNADDKTELPCNTCDNCQAINRGAFLDVVEIDAASHTGVDNIRELIEQAQSVPAIGAYKVYILDEVHMLSTPAFNALLKTLEEPPAHVVFILCTTESQKVPITVASRCQRFVFSRANNAQLKQLLTTIANKEKINIDESSLTLLAQLADGGYRDGVMLLEQTAASYIQGNAGEDQGITRGFIEQLLGLASLDLTQQLLELILKKQTAEAINVVEQFVSQGGEISYVTSDIIQLTRLLLHHKLKTKTAEAQVDGQQIKWLDKMAAEVELSQISHVLKELMASSNQKTSASHPALSLEMAIINLSQRPAMPANHQPTKEIKQSPASSPAPIPSTSSGSHARPNTQAAHKPQGEVMPTCNQEIKKSTPQPVEPPADLADGWQKVLSGVLEQNKSVGALLRHHCTPVSHDGTIIMLQFWNAFHKKQVELDKNRRLVEKVAEDVFGQQIRIQGQLADKSLRPQKKPMTEEDLHNVAPVAEENLADTAAEIFGGEFVD